MRLVATIEGESIIEFTDLRVVYLSKAAIDADGSGSSHGDKYFQPDTSLHLNGKPLNADEDKYVVVPPAIIFGVKGIVMGCHAHIKNLTNGKESDAVVGDTGPHKKLGEISIALAKALGLNSSPISGGEFKHTIFYTLYPGKAALVDGKQYVLQGA